MSVEHGSRPHEANLPDLTFADVEAVEQLRQDQYEEVAAAARQATERHTDPFAVATTGVQEFTADKQRLAEQIPETSGEYLSRHLDKDQHPEAYQKLSELLQATSIHRMDSIKWLYGDKDENGEYVPGTSGIDMVRQTLAELRGEYGASDELPSQPDIPELTPERIAAYEAAKTELIEARNTLAGLSIARRQTILKGTQKNKDLEDDYLAAQERYEAAIIEIGRLKVQRKREQGLSEEELKGEAVKAIVAEHQEFAKAEQKILEDDDSRRGRFAKWLAKKWHLEAASAGTGFVIGGVSKWALGAVFGTLVGVTGGIAAGAAYAARSTKAVLMAPIHNKADAIRHFDERRDADSKNLEAGAHAELDANDDEALLLGANGLLQNTLDTRVETDRKKNARRLALAATIGGAAALLGVGIESALEGAGVLPGLGLFEHHGPEVGGGHHHPQLGHQGGHHGGHNHGHQKQGGHKTGQHEGRHHQHPVHKPGVVDGFRTHVRITHGEGYQQAAADLAQQKGIRLTDAQSWNLYEHLNDQFHGHFLTNDPSYHMNNAGHWGISRPGLAQWRADVVRAENHWLNQHNLNGNLHKLGKKAAKKAGKVAMAASRR